jgi:hypothetical protein
LNPRGRIALLLAFACVALFAAISRGVFLYGDDVLMFQVTEAIVERGAVDVLSTAKTGEAAQSIPGRDGRRFAKYGIAPSLVAIPFYAASGVFFDRLELTETSDGFGNLRTGGRVFGTSLTNAVVGGIAVVLAFLLALELGASTLAAFVAALLLAVGTLWAHYSATFLSEPLSGLCLVGSFFALLRAGKKALVKGGTSDLGWLAISGFAGGALVATKAAMVVGVVPVGLWAAWLAWRRGDLRASMARCLAWALPFAVWLGGIAFYNWSRFGDVFATGYGKEARLFTTPLLDGLSGLLFSPTKGIVWYCPVVVFSLFGLFLSFRRVRSPEAAAAAGAAAAAVTAGASALCLLLFAKYYQWYGGGAWGPRFLVPLLPLWMAFAALALDRLRAARALTQVVASGIVLASLAATLAGSLLPFDDDPYFLVDRPREFRKLAWEPGRSPLLDHLGELPRAVAVTAGKLVTTDDASAAGAALAATGVPDFAFVRYGSHALLQWTRAMLVAFAGLLAAAAFAAARAGRPPQKALLSIPPQ